MPGPPRKPTRIRILEGNASKRPLPSAEPKPTEGTPTRPEWVAPEAKREWRRIVPELRRLGLLTLVDRAALVGYCQQWGRYVQAEKILTEKGLTFETENGYVMQRPEVAIATKALQLVKAFCTEFGLTPAARARLSAPDAKVKGLDDILEERA